MTRNPNWRPKLHQYFSDIRRTPFDKDKNNCAQFVANGWLIMRPDDPFKKYRKLKTFGAILRAVKKDGYENHMDFFATFMTAYDHPSQARVGDVAVFECDDEIGFASGWVFGERVFVLRETGLASLPLSDAIKAFAV